MVSQLIKSEISLIKSKNYWRIPDCNTLNMTSECMFGMILFYDTVLQFGIPVNYELTTTNHDMRECADF